MKYKYGDINVDPALEHLEPWLDSVYEAAIWCNCTFLILMEDDSIMKKPLIRKPPHDAGGVAAGMWTRHWSQPLKDQFGADRWSYDSHGMCGGSYLRVAAFIDAYKRMDWNRMYEMGKAFKGTK